MSEKPELQSKYCVYCGASIRRRLESIPYKTGICYKCINKRDECIEIKRKVNALKQQKYYKKHRKTSSSTKD